MNKSIYLDFNASTPVDPRVADRMNKCLCECFGNPSSLNHPFGWEAESLVKTARKQVAELLHADPKEIIFTSGATESNNLAIYGYLKQFRREKHHLITSAVEHKAVLDVCQMCAEDWGTEITILKPDSTGRILPEVLQQAIRPATKLVSIMAANNEIGTINPIAALASVCKKQNIIFHSDAAQAAAKININVREWNCDMLSLSGHKMYGPKGVGALYVRHELLGSISPIMAGGGQESGLRPGTHNVPGIVGLGEACEIAMKEMPQDHERLIPLRDLLIAEVLKQVPTARLNGPRDDRIYSNVSFSFSDLSADVFALGLSGLALSSGSACSTGQTSHVLRAIGLPDKLVRATVRIGIGRMTTTEHVQKVISKIVDMVKKNKVISNV